MCKILFGVWLLCGIVAIWRDYHGFLKYWYKMTGKSAWEYPSDRFILKTHGWFYLLTFSLGPILLLATETSNETHYGAWWFTTKNKSNNSNK